MGPLVRESCLNFKSAHNYLIKEIARWYKTLKILADCTNFSTLEILLIQANIHFFNTKAPSKLEYCKSFRGIDKFQENSNPIFE